MPINIVERIWKISFSLLPININSSLTYSFMKDQCLDSHIMFFSLFIIDGYNNK